MTSVLFGAGASRDFFSPALTTQYLTDAVKSWGNWERVLDHYHQIKGADTVVPTAADVLQIINLILERNPSFTFEQIAEVLDKLCSYWFDPLPTNTMLGSLEFAFNAIYAAGEGWSRMHGWDDIPFLFRQIIAEAILDLQNNHRAVNCCDLSKLQNQFIGSLCANNEKVSLISLNYDECVADSISGLGFDTCFNQSQHPGQLNELSIPSFFNAKRVIYYPHGHLRFRFTDQLNAEYYHDSNSANKARWEGLDSATVGCNMPITQGKFAYNFNSFLTTGQTKDDILNFLPYAVYYQRMAIDMIKTDTLFIIGYSLGDDHINRLLKSYLRIAPTHQVVIVDYYPEDITMTQEHHDSESIILKIQNVFGVEWRVNVSQTGVMSAWNEQEVKTLNATGFGKIFDNVYFYKNGYTKFLQDWNVRLIQI